MNSQLPSILAANLNKSFTYKLPNQTKSLKHFLFPPTQQFQAVKQLSFQINPGEIVGFIGPNGAGKSTTIKMLTGILKPDSGDLTVLNLNPQTQRRQLSYQLGTVFGQRSNLWFHLPAIDTFNLHAKLYEIPTSEFQTRLDHILNIFQIEYISQIPVKKLSLGQRMKCELALSLLHNPKILLLDEPSIGLDIDAKFQIRQIIKTINRDQNTTIILTSHDIDDIEQLCDRVIIINRGQKVYDGKTDLLKTKFLTEKQFELHIDPTGQTLSTFKFPQSKIINHSDYHITLKVPADSATINQFFNYLNQTWQIKDITVSDTPLEELISRIYNQPTN